MIAKGAPDVIHNDEELEAYTNALFRLTALENPSPPELEAIELLTLVVERYEETTGVRTRQADCQEIWYACGLNRGVQEGLRRNRALEGERNSRESLHMGRPTANCVSDP